MDTMAQVTVESAGVDDAFAVAALHLQHDRGAGAPPEPGFLDRFVDWWLPQLATRPTWLATDGSGDPVGVLAATTVVDRPRVGRGDDTWLYLTFLYVPPAHRQRGVAARLVTHAQTWSGARGIARVQVRSSEQARGLYARLGFGPAPGDQLEWRPQP